jgi:ElaB/YqjD/DUF883 family membrane-anchored ribosome-binding protein
MPTNDKSKRRLRPAVGSVGLPVDSGGGPTVDPTENVKDSIEALRLLHDNEMRHSREIDAMRDDHTRELDRIREAYSKSKDGWTVDTLGTHFGALREADLKFEVERDRRYAEVALEREKALKIKEEADKAALALAREIQTYKDEKANELREQINSERGLYASKDDVRAAVDKVEATVRPLAEYVTAERGRGVGISASWGLVTGIISILVSLLLIGGAVVSVVLFIARSKP